MTDVACFCGCVYAFAGDVGVCPKCGEAVSFILHPGLEEATELDDGDPHALSGAQQRLGEALPNLTIVDSSRGFDAQQVSRLAHRLIAPLSLPPSSFPQRRM